MQDATPSKTALATSLMRAAHTRLDPHPLINDPWGDRLVPDSVRELMRARAAETMSPKASADEYLLSSQVYANVIIRSRYTEDALQSAVARGVRQYVLIGAGFDSFALRRPSFAADLEIFEIDHPATQTFKIGQIERCGFTPPKKVHYISADLAERSVAEVLADSPFRRDQATFFSWLGVSMYLSKEANFATLRSIASCALQGSELVFTYIDARMLESKSADFLEVARTVAAMGEPFTFGFNVDTLDQDLRKCGLAVMEDLDNRGMARRYHRPDLDRGDSARFSHIALTRVI
jgi:methyltransferase (TIGR00027 family)